MSSNIINEISIQPNSKSINQVEQKEENSNFQLSMDLDNISQDNENFQNTMSDLDGFPNKETDDLKQYNFSPQTSPNNLNQKEQATMDQDVQREESQIDYEYHYQDSQGALIVGLQSSDVIQDEVIDNFQQTIINVQSQNGIYSISSQKIREWFIRNKFDNPEYYYNQIFLILEDNRYMQLLIQRFPNELKEILIILKQNDDSHQDMINHNIIQNQNQGIQSESDEDKDFKGLYQENLQEDFHSIMEENE